MPEHESWFSLTLSPLYRFIESLTMSLNAIVTGSSDTWIAHQGYGHGGASVDHVVSALFVLLLATAMAFVANSKLKDAKAALIPEETLTIRTFFELFIGAVLGMMEPIMGKKPARYFLPLIGTCAVFILFSNGMGLIPGFLPPTTSGIRPIPAVRAVISTGASRSRLPRSTVSWEKGWPSSLIRWK